MDNAAVTGPGWLHSAGLSIGHLVGTHGALFAACAGTIQAAVGLSVLLPRTRRAGLAAGMALAVFYSVVGQAFGGIFSNGLALAGSGATDPGTGPIIVLLALSLWPRHAAGVGVPSAPVQPATRLARRAASGGPVRQQLPAGYKGRPA